MAPPLVAGQALSAQEMTDSSSARALLTAAAVRERAQELLQVGIENGLEHFAVEIDRLPQCADFVVEVVRERHPTLAVPFHARWRHFVVWDRDLWAERAAAAGWKDAAAKARATFDLAIVSVLLDAGAGPEWRYRDAATGMEIGRSEGLAIASLRLFEAGLFSADPTDPLRVDADRLVTLTADDLAAGLQTSHANPLLGLEGRVALLARLGKAVAANPAVFAIRDAPRPGGLFDHLTAAPSGRPLPAQCLLESLLEHLASIWPGRLSLQGVALGDTWRHPAIRRDDATDKLVPFHKLSQWLAYSLIEPIQATGIDVTDIDGLTGLAEYRNGGLFVDTGVIRLRDPCEAGRPHSADSFLVVEWRALTVALLDRIAPLVRDRLGVSALDFPLARILEGGTWAAGRRLAYARRADGSPPIQIVSDGTVF
jgi:hypothetical protein